MAVAKASDAPGLTGKTDGTAQQTLLALIP